MLWTWLTWLSHESLATPVCRFVVDVGSADLSGIGERIISHTVFVNLWHNGSLREMDSSDNNNSNQQVVVVIYH